jgi:3-deoxy-D-manno-octulosonic-acid transferase
LPDAVFEDSPRRRPHRASIIRKALQITAKSLSSDNLRTRGAGGPALGPPAGGHAPLFPLLWERFLPRRESTPADVWIHAVSVGEIEIAATLATALRDRVPELALLVSATTPAGVALLPSRFGPDSGISHRPSPFDLGASVRRFFDTVRPGILVLVETELWPRMLGEAARRRVPVVVANGRLSERSLRRLRLARPLFRRALAAITRVAARTPDDAARFAAAGIDAARIFVAGDLKLDRPLAPEPAFAERLRALADRRPVVVAGSVAAGEIPVLLAARRSLRAAGADALFVVAPRQPAAFDETARRLASGGLAVVRRSDTARADERADAFLLDTIGELASAYRGAAVALLGGTFVDRGGHNVLEPLRAGLPVVHGPSVRNIRAALEAAAGAVFPARDGDDAGRILAGLLRDDDGRRRAGEAATALFSRHAGATARAAEAILELRAGAA